MELIEVSPEMDKRRETFLRLVFEKGSGYFCIAYGPPDRDPKKFREEFFKFPNEIPQALELVNKVYIGHNVWFCPHLFGSRRRRKESVTYTPCSWSDLDTCEPEALYIAPTITIESSPGRYQALWMYETAPDPDEAENVSQRIAYAHAEDGADRSGWDLTQLLRMPYTYNYKYASTPTVSIIDANRKLYRLKDFDRDYDQVASYQQIDIPMPDISDIDAAELMDKQRMQISPTVWRLYQEPLPPDASWSEPLWKLMMYLFEAGFGLEQVFAVANSSACNKYEKRGAPLEQLWKDVCRAHNQFQATARGDLQTTGVVRLVSDQERREVLSEESIVERYISWASALGDAAVQYHQAGAFTALSALLAGAVQLPTSFGTIKPNLWFMILADTTLTRKSTAMDIAMDLIMEIDDDVVMATDGSLEGMLTSLSTRPGKPSVFLRDEFSGLLESITRKDYYAGMPEMLTKLYDGKMQKRILRKESIDVRDPCFLIFAGGIKNKITSLLSFEHVSSGFMPRFVFITAESDVTRVKPLGPPTDWTDNNRQAILDELTDLYEYYANQETVMTITGSNIAIHQQKKFDAALTPEAWRRYNEMEALMLDLGMKSSRPDIMTPVYDRLAKSMLKASILLAASRKKQDPVVVELSDVVRAMVYGEQWREFVEDVMNNVGMGQNERTLENIVRAIERRPGISRSAIMQNHHLDARAANMIFDTLEQRGRITRQRKGKSETLWPTVIELKEKV